MSKKIPLHSHRLDDVTEYDDPSGWSVRTYTYEGQKYTDLYERPSDKGWVTPLVIDTAFHHISPEDIAGILKVMSTHKTRGNHTEKHLDGISASND